MDPKKRYEECHGKSQKAIAECKLKLGDKFSADSYKYSASDNRVWNRAIKQYQTRMTRAYRKFLVEEKAMLPWVKKFESTINEDQSNRP